MEAAHTCSPSTQEEPGFEASLVCTGERWQRQTACPPPLADGDGTRVKCQQHAGVTSASPSSSLWEMLPEAPGMPHRELILHSLPGATATSGAPGIPGTQGSEPHPASRINHPLLPFSKIAPPTPGPMRGRDTSANHAAP